ncbi:MAG: DUF3618 domain-containing protein [Gemmatimonadota bacterium]
MTSSPDSAAPWIGITDTMETVRPDGSHEPTPAQIEEDIRRTRDRISREVEAIGERLSPQYLKERAQEAVMEKVRGVASDAGERARQAGSSAVQFVRDHPVSSALISVGIAWMLLENSGRGSKSGAPATETGPDGLAAAGNTAVGGKISDAVSGAIGRVSEPVSDFAGAAREKAAEFSNQATDTASGLADRAHDQTSAVADETRTRAHPVEHSARSTFERNPLAVGAVALAAGALIGFLLPRTGQEDRLMGTTRDRIIDRAMEKATAAREVAVKTAQRVGQTAKDEAAHLHADDLRADFRSAAEAMKSSAERVLHDARETARQEAARQNLLS